MTVFEIVSNVVAVSVTATKSVAVLVDGKKDILFTYFYNNSGCRYDCHYIFWFFDFIVFSDGHVTAIIYVFSVFFLFSF